MLSGVAYAKDLAGPTWTSSAPTIWRHQMFNDNGSFLVAMFEFFIFFAWIMCLC